MKNAGTGEMRNEGNEAVSVLEVGPFPRPDYFCRVCTKVPHLYFCFLYFTMGLWLRRQYDSSQCYRAHGGFQYNAY